MQRGPTWLLRKFRLGVRRFWAWCHTRPEDGMELRALRSLLRVSAVLVLMAIIERVVDVILPLVGLDPLLITFVKWGTRVTIAALIVGDVAKYLIFVIAEVVGSFRHSFTDGRRDTDKGDDTDDNTK